MPIASDRSQPEIISHKLLSYEEGLRLQTVLHRDVVSGRSPGFILLLEHLPVLTLGKHADEAFVLSERNQLKSLGVELVQSDRGGEVTAHMPGQLVVYPILPLQLLRLPPKLYIDKLMRSVIASLGDFGITAKIDKDYPGVWVGEQKICAVGVRIAARVSMHGLALNISNDLDLFNRIVPCGIHHRGVCSMQSILGHSPSREEFESVFLRRFFEVFSWDKMINLDS